ncbi:MAG: DUF2147 domain-containing protein [Ideonella sp.]|jgi:uncharacterized protein (DUF2147 family)|nr:DUF2147 domain-containing protein [Ideonella sp.]
MKPVSPPRAITMVALWFCAVASCLADAGLDPTGSWRTVDDRTGQDRSVIRIERQGDLLSGRVVRSLDPRDDPAARCVKCPGDRKDQPIVGMAILSGLRPSTSNVRLWEGGEILDPDSGSVYRARVRLSEDGRTLEVRGFLGMALFGRTQVWKRAE